MLPLSTPSAVTTTVAFDVIVEAEQACASRGSLRNMAYRIFISYSTKDMEKVNVLRSSIGIPGVTCFISEYDTAPGILLTPTILEEIKRCDLFVLLWSKSAASSEWVSQEIGAAKGAKKQILPFLLEEELSLPGFIRDIRYVPAFGGLELASRWLREIVAAKAKENLDDARLTAILAVGLAVLLFVACYDSPEGSSPAAS